MSAVATRVTNETLQDLVERLGSIGLERIAAWPPPGTATEEDLVAVLGAGDRLYELVDATLVEKAMGWYESRLAVTLIVILEEFLRVSALGIVLGADGLVRLAPGMVRIPDVSFFSWGHFPNRARPKGQFMPAAPDLAVEILSVSNTKAEMHRKLHDYFNAGTLLVWYVEPATESVRVYTQPDRWSDLTTSDTLDGGEPLPGFHLVIQDWFNRAWPKESM